MYKNLLFIILFFVLSNNIQGQNVSSRANLKTPWTDQVGTAPHREYPRPQLVRHNNWQNLNGLWKYTLTGVSQTEIPSTWDGDILVPFAIESALSGVKQNVGKDQSLWYYKEINFDKQLKRSNNIILHFGAVDWQCDVYVNKQLVGSHEGGFDPFSFDISKFLKKGNTQEIVVRVWDPTDEGPQPRGKQVKNPHGIWYTPVTGIWQTVWLESVPSSYIVHTRHTPDLDDQILNIQAQVANALDGDVVKVKVLDNSRVLHEHEGLYSNELIINTPGLTPWSPKQPKLYDLEIELIRKGKVIDRVESYFAMRKISFQKDRNGIRRMLLNNEFVFQYGPLDQGWWPDGLHTAPSDEALMFDIIKTKEMGFNMIRKHIKVEPARWYRHCDSIGLLVWQDMPSGDLGGNIWDMHPGKIRNGNHDKNRSSASESMYRKEWKAIMDALHNFPSIVVWVPFNEGWGQFKTKEIVDWTSAYDPSRLINGASGGNFNAPGDIFDIHNYPDAAMPDPILYGSDYILALGEFGGLGLPIDGHTWQLKDNWGYQSFKNKEELKNRYFGLVNDLYALIKKGLSAAVYTQTTDVEIETNGLMTYDREVIKMPVHELKKTHEKLYEKNLVEF